MDVKSRCCPPKPVNPLSIETISAYEGLKAGEVPREKATRICQPMPNPLLGKDRKAISRHFGP